MRYLSILFFLFCITACGLQPEESSFGEPILLNPSVYDSTSRNSYELSMVQFINDVSKKECYAYLEDHKMEPVGIKALHLLPIEKLPKESWYNALEHEDDFFTEFILGSLGNSAFHPTSDTTCHVSFISYFEPGNYLLCFKKLN